MATQKVNRKIIKNKLISISNKIITLKRHFRSSIDVSNKKFELMVENIVHYFEIKLTLQPLKNSSGPIKV